MEFSPEELDISPPCFLVDNSQAEESQQVCRSDSDQHVSILKRLPVFAMSASICSTNESLRRHPVVRSRPTGSGGGEPGDSRGEQRNCGQEQGGGGGSRERGTDGDAGGNSRGAGGGYGGGDGGDDGGGGDDDDDREGDDDHEDDSPPADEPSSSSSSDQMPSLVRPEAVTGSSQWKGQKFSVSELHAQHSAGSGTDSNLLSPGEVVQQGGNHSQAFSGIVGEGAHDAADVHVVSGSGSLSEGSTGTVECPSEKRSEKKSTSSSSDGHKSGQGSSASSSSYHGDLSSLSSGGSMGPSPEVRKHLPLLSMLRTQSTSDTSSSSAGSKEGKVRATTSGYRIWSLEEIDEPEVCSSQEDMFAPHEVNKEQDQAQSDLSPDGSHILPPQHHSTPTDGHSSKGCHGHAHEKSLYQKVLTANQRTSTPVEGREFLQTPPSQGTPIEFQSLHFSGETSTKNTSSSTSEKVEPSPEERSSIPMLTPSSPTAVAEEGAASTRAKNGHEVTAKETSSSSSEKLSVSSEEQSSVSAPHVIPSSPRAVGDKKPSGTKQGNEVTAKETSSSSSGKLSLSSEEHSSVSAPHVIPSSPVDDKPEVKEKPSGKEEKSERPKRTISDHEEKEGQSEMARAAAELVELFDLSQEKQAEKTTSHPVNIQQEMSVDDEVTLPRWQLVQNVPQEDVASKGKKSSSSTSSSSNSSSLEKPSSKNTVEDGSQPAEIQQWQSLISAVGSSSSSFHGQRMEATDNVSTSKKEQHVQNVDMSFLEREEDPPLISKAVCPKETTQEDQSVSPSSLVIDPSNELNVTTKASEKDPLVAPGPTQPDMSDDMFRPSITQESAGPQHGVSDHPVDEPKQDDVIADESQEIVFSLHLTQSQSDMDSQAPFPSSLPIEDNQEEVAVIKVTSVVNDDKSAEQIEKEQISSLTKQDSNSQSILASLVRPIGVQEVPSVKDTHTVEDKEQATRPALPHVSSLQVEEKGDNEIEVVSGNDPLPSTEDVAPVEPVLVDDSVRVPLLTKEDTIDVSRPELSTPEKPVPARKPIKSRLPATIFSETSSDSALSGGFHFSLPKEPLRPQVSTTPPPIRPAHHRTPDSEDRGSRRSIMPDAVLPVVSETPGMSSQAPPSSLVQARPQSLTISMPRHGSPLSDSENSEPVFRFHTAFPSVSPSRASSSNVQIDSPERQRSIFSRAREAMAKGKKREEVVDNDDDPFAFTAEDEDPGPLRKRARRSSPRSEGEKEFMQRGEQGQTRDIPIESAVWSTSFVEHCTTRSKRQEDSTEQDNLHGTLSAKRGHPEGSSGSSESEEPEEPQSKRARREDDRLHVEEMPEKDSSEDVHYRQIIHTRTVTTVTTQVQRMVTVSIIDKGSGEVVQVLTYEEDDRPKVESEEKENEEVNEFVESSNVDGSRTMVTSKLLKQKDKKQQPRSSPRIKSKKSPVSAKAASKRPGEAEAASAKSSDDEARENIDHPQSADETASVIPAVTRQETVPVTEEEPALQRTSSSDSSLTPGTLVLAKWHDGYFYPGVVSTKQYKNGRYLVTFDDGNKRRAPRENIIRKDLLPAGQRVMAQGEDDDDYYEEGVIVGYYRDGEERGYEIQTRSGAISRFPRSKVILSEQQAAAILSSESSVNVTSGSSVSIGAHSLRLRKDESTGSSDLSTPNVTRSGSAAGKDTMLDTSSKDTSKSSSGDKRRGKKPLPRASPKGKASKDNDVTPKSTHKSASHKAKAQLRRAGHRIGVESDTSSDEQTAQTGKRRQVRRGLSASYASKSPLKSSSDEPGPVTRSSPRKQMVTNEDDDRETAISPLPTNRNVFAGFAFLVTGSLRDRTEPDESDSESERIEFNRDIIKRQIEAGGGVVLSAFPQSQISGAECFLISDRHQRTQKYFQSLASGIPCVSHMWINDCCSSNKRLDYKRYLLPAGESLEAEGEIVECRPRRNILGNIRVFLHGSQQFRDTWTSVLLAAGCKMVTKIPNRFDYYCDVIVCENSKLPASVKHAASMLGIPMVSLEWLLQSLINGRQVAFDGHPKYDYRYKSA